jgi:outer membrane lipase/esterase
MRRRVAGRTLLAPTHDLETGMRSFLPAVLLTVLVAGAAHASLFDQFVIFGDSLSDNGNAYIATGGATPAPPLYTTFPSGLGSFTDGPDTVPAGTGGGIWHEVLASLLGVPPAEPFLLPNGTNYAVGGAQVLQNVPDGPFTIPSLQTQVGTYLASVGGSADPNSLYILWGGANDLYSAVETPGETAAGIAATETAMVVSLSDDIAALAANGAKDFLWLNLPQLGTTPRGAADLAAVSPAVGTAFTNASTQFASDVSSESALLESALGVTIADVNIYGLYQSILADPSAFGYTNVTGYAQGNASANPDQYLFWDFDSHPTTTGHVLIGEAADAAVLSTFVPEPETWAMAGLGALLVLWRRRK